MKEGSSLAAVQPPLPFEAPVQGSYGQILRSSSIIGGAQAINYAVGLVRTKLVAVLIGPAGVGLVGVFVSATAVIETLAGMGLSSSGVRDVAEAYGTGDPTKAAKTAAILRRMCWITGGVGWLLTLAFSFRLSNWAFGSAEHAGALAALGATILLGNIAAGQSALLQGARRIGDLARANVSSAVANTLMAACLYAWLGRSGIVPVLICTAAVNLIFAWWFARRITSYSPPLLWSETLAGARKLLGLGVAFMWSALLTAAVAFAIRAVVARDLGLEANGLYQAAWGLSGLFAGFILTAMGTDFYPRLTAVAADDEKVNRLVNEQTEIGILLALPGLIGTLAFAPWLMQIFYTKDFVSASGLLPWFVLGIFGRVASWPMGFMLMAKREAAWYAATETLANVLHVFLSLLFIRWLGLWGVSLAFATLYAFYTVGMLCIAGCLTSFTWTTSVWKLLAISMVLICLGFVVQRSLPPVPAAFAGALLGAGAVFVSVRGLARRLGHNHRLVRAACHVPGVAALCRI